MQLPRAQLLRLLSLLFAAAWTFAPVAEALHADQHAHHYCEQHQAFEESAAKAVASAQAEPSAQLASGDEVSSSLHERCAYLAFSVRSALANPAVAQLAEQSQAQPATVIGEAAEHRSVAILAAAPKSSPPEA